MRIAVNEGWTFELVPTTSKDILAVDSILRKL
jgi:hypothetical protein